MKKIDLGQVITILANIGVIAGIVFLGIEISQNTRSLQAEAYRELTNTVVDLNRFTLTNRETTRGLSDAEAGPQTNEGNDQFLLNINLLRYGDLAYQHYELGMLSRDRLDSIPAPLDQVLCRGDFQQHWSALRELEVFVPAYQEFLDARVRARGC
jgi:hypothetical protein